MLRHTSTAARLVRFRTILCRQYHGFVLRCGPRVMLQCIERYRMLRSRPGVQKVSNPVPEWVWDAGQNSRRMSGRGSISTAMSADIWLRWSIRGAVWWGMLLWISIVKYSRMIIARATSTCKVGMSEISLSVLVYIYIYIYCQIIELAMYYCHWLWIKWLILLLP